MMQISGLLADLDVGNSVAEFDEHLHSYFVETHIYREFIEDRYDIVSGDKGAGKTAIFKIVRERYRAIPEMSDVELLAGFNNTGNPVFQRLSQTDELPEGQYITIWKNYILALLGNYLLDICEGYFTPKMIELDKILRSLELRTTDPTASTVFSQLTNLIKRLTKPKSAEVTVTVSEVGMPVLVPRIKFAETQPETVNGQDFINNDDALKLLDEAINDLGIRVWIVLDRLDEAFAGFQSIEIPTLRALLRTYLDSQEFSNFKLKLFVRNDLFRKITKGGFVNLTHVNARRRDINWNKEDLFALLCQRIRRCEKLLEEVAFSSTVSDEELFSLVFPNQIDVGAKKPTSWNWILARIRDGNDALPPRNLIDIVNKSKEYQLRREQRDPREFKGDTPLIESESVRKAFAAVSDLRVQDTLLAESDILSPYIEAFRNGKAEHTLETAQNTLEISGSQFTRTIEDLKALGFFEEVGEYLKIPMIYQPGLNISQGKAA